MKRKNSSIDNKINFCVVFCKTKKKIDKYFKTNKIKNKFVIDIKKLKEELDIVEQEDIQFLKLELFQRIQLALDKNKDVYYIPVFDDTFSMEKLLNLKKILGENNFNILVFHEEFKTQPHYLKEALDNLPKFNHSQILKDY